MRSRVILLGALAALVSLLLVPPALAAPVPAPYRANDGGGFRNILPPGSNGLANGVDLAAFLSAQKHPAHSDDQLKMYENLVHAVPGLKPSDLDRFFKDASFGVPAGQVARSYSPRDDVTIIRDKAFGVPHIYGSTRAGTMFGIGYATAEDRLFFIDALRHVGRGQTSSFAGGSQSNRDQDRESWFGAPYLESDLQRQYDLADDVYGARGIRLRDDADAYTAGINRYISETKLDPLKLPAEYPALGHFSGPEPFKSTDLFAIATLVGGIFGKGGGNELKSALLRQAFDRRFGARLGYRRWRDFRSAEDPEALTTVRGRRFPFRLPLRRPRGRAMPDGGKLVEPLSVLNKAGAATRATPGEGLLGPTIDSINRGVFPNSASNALVVSARESATGSPLAVFGPQVSYFAPQILMEQDVHGPGIDARGVAFPGTNLYVQLGRGRDYAWSATSAGNDVVDTFAVPLCEANGSKPTTASMSYVFRGKCTPIEVLDRTNSWSPSAGDMTPAGSETLRAYRTKYGIARQRATVHGKPVVYTSLRSTYFHEADSALGFDRLNDPSQIHGPKDFQAAASEIGFTFNWFYTDAKHIAYFNSGWTPERATRADTEFPVFSSLEWKGWNPDLNLSRRAPNSTHPQFVDQSYAVNWNGKQARGYAADDGNYTYSSVDRGQTLDRRVRAGIRGSRKMTLSGLTEAMEDAGTVDLRAQEILPYALRAIGRTSNPAVNVALAKLRAWAAAGGHRRDVDNNGAYEHADAVAILDAWWPLWIQAQFQRRLGVPLAKRIIGYIGLGDMPSIHQGSSFDDGIYGQAQKDLRAVLGLRVRGRLSTRYCGNGSRGRCRADLIRTLTAALAVPRTTLYHGDECTAGDQRCNDEIRFRALGAVTQPPMEWVNRPTFQQVVNVQRDVP